MVATDPGLVTACAGLACALGQVPLHEALDGEGLVWTSGGSSYLPSEAEMPGCSGIATANAFDGVDVARPLAGIEQGLDPWISTDVSGPGVLRFHWKVDGQLVGERLPFTIMW